MQAASLTGEIAANDAVLTLLAPTNDALARLPESDIQTLLATPEALSLVSFL